MNDRSIDIIIDGIRTHIKHTGAGQPPLLLVHGLGGPGMWDRVIEPLSHHVHVINLHLPGFGESDCPPLPYSTLDYAKFILDALDTLKIERAIIVGASYGGEIAVHVAIINDRIVERLILINSTGFQQYGGLPGFLLRLKAICFLLKEVILKQKWLICLLARRSFYDSSKRPADLCDTFYRQLMQPGKRDVWLNSMRNLFLGTEQVPELLNTTTTPTLLIWGEHDRMVKSLKLASVKLKLPNVSSIVIPEAGHSLPLEKPAELCKLIQVFKA